MNELEYLDNVDFLKDVSECSYYCFTNNNKGEEGEALSEAMVNDFCTTWGCNQETYLKAIAKNHNRYKRAKRVFQRTADLVTSGQAVFLTLTFTDEVFNSTSVDTRRQYVRKFLKAQAQLRGCNNYCANIDFGSDNSYTDFQGIERRGTCREHYHAIIGCLVDLKAWHYGFALAEKIHTSKVNAKRTSKYVTKLSCHAIKKSTGKAYRIIYSRGMETPVYDLISNSYFLPSKLPAR